MLKNECTLGYDDTVQSKQYELLKGLTSLKQGLRTFALTVIRYIFPDCCCLIWGMGSENQSSELNSMAKTHNLCSTLG